MKLFAGPCLLESEEDAFLVAKTITENLPEGVDYYFKASFDKQTDPVIRVFVDMDLDSQSRSLKNCVMQVTKSSPMSMNHKTLRSYPTM